VHSNFWVELKISQMYGETSGLVNRETCREADGPTEKTNRQTDRHTNRQRDRETGRQTSRQIDIPRDRQRDKQTVKQLGGRGKTENQTKIKKLLI
jgi:hypothetical protein